MSQSDAYAEMQEPARAVSSSSARSTVSQDLDIRFSAHSVGPREADQITAIRYECRRLAGIISGAVPAGRERSLAITALEEAMFWANAGIARS